MEINWSNNTMTALLNIADTHGGFLGIPPDSYAMNGSVVSYEKVYGNTPNYIVETAEDSTYLLEPVKAMVDYRVGFNEHPCLSVLNSKDELLAGKFRVNEVTGHKLQPNLIKVVNNFSLQRSSMIVTLTLWETQYTTLSKGIKSVPTLAFSLMGGRWLFSCRRHDEITPSGDAVYIEPTMAVLEGWQVSNDLFQRLVDEKAKVKTIHNGKKYWLSGISKPLDTGVDMKAKTNADCESIFSKVRVAFRLVWQRVKFPMSKTQVALKPFSKVIKKISSKITSLKDNGLSYLDKCYALIISQLISMKWQIHTANNFHICMDEPVMLNNSYSKKYVVIVENTRYIGKALKN